MPSSRPRSDMMDSRNDMMQAEGFFTIELLRDGKSGPEVVERRVTPNVVVTAGKKQTWRHASGLNTHYWRYCRIGTCGTAPTSNNANCLSVIASTLTSCDSKTMVSGRTFQIIKSYPSGTGKISATNIKEVIICNAKTTNAFSCLARATFTAVNKTTSD